jgi:hypothetical protein
VTVSSAPADLIYFPADVTNIDHSTDLYGLQGVVDNHELWLTHSRYSNDDEELTHSFELVLETIEETASRPRFKKHKEYLKVVAQIIETPPVECCFCKEDSLLSQYRSDSVHGLEVSSGFNRGEFSSITGPDSAPGGLVRCLLHPLQVGIIESTAKFSDF